MDSQQKIKDLVEKNDIVLFMKGTPEMPQCGFSAQAIRILRDCGVHSLHTVNVLADDEMRQGAKVFASWPTFPQLYVKGEFIGGADIMTEMYQSKELQAKLAQS